MSGVEESYHITPEATEDDLLKGEARESSPCMESALLSNQNDPPATGVVGGISAEEMAAAVASIAQPDQPSMPTEAEFLGQDQDVDY